MSSKKLGGIRLMAKKLGVSTATISRALNPETSSKVKEGRRREIMELADKMRFRPNPGARLIQKGHNSALGVLIPNQEDVFFSEFYGRLLGSLLRAASQANWEVRINAIDLKGKDVLEEFRRFGLGAGGLIYAGQPLIGEQVAKLAGFYSPLILMRSTLPPDYPLEDVGCHVIGVDNFHGAISVANYITGLGHTRIGLLLGPSESRDFHEREAGYHAGLAQAGITLDPEMIYRGSFDQESGRKGCRYFLGKKHVPTALICASDSLAFGAIDYAKEHGLKCPGNLSVIGFDDGPWAIASSPKLTTMRQPLGALMEHAVALLGESIKNVSGNHQKRLFLMGELKVRQSTSFATS